MKKWNGTCGRFIICIAALALLCTGCQQYGIEVTVEPDGSGKRSIELTTSSLARSGAEPSADDFRILFGLKEEDGWYISKRKPGGEEEGDESSGYIFTLEREAADLADWRNMSGDINISAAFPSGKYYNVKFHNTVGVEIARGTNARSVTYRETIGWNSLKEELVDFFASWYHDSMAVTYPELGTAELAELRGLLAGHLSMGLVAIEETGDFDAESVAREMVSMATGIIRRARPDVETEEVHAITEAILSDSTNKFERFTAREMPGVELAFFTEINLRVTMPGRIVESNADEVQERTAIWKLDIMRTINRPMELFVRSEMVE